MSDLADRHRQIAAVLDPIERMGIEASVDTVTTEAGDLCLAVSLRIPARIDPIRASDAVEVTAAPAPSDDPATENDATVTGGGALEDPSTRTDAAGDPEEATAPSGEADLTAGQRETLHALQDMGGARTSGEIAEQVDATLESVRSWLPTLAQAGHIRANRDPGDGRRKLYSAVDADDPTDDHDPAESEETVYIASSGGSPSQVYHAREDCPQLQKSTDSVAKDLAVVPNHRPCRTCVHDRLEDGLVAIAKGSSTTTYHEREDCPKLESAINVAVQQRDTVPNHEPCSDCVDPSEEQAAGSRHGDSGERGQEDSETAPTSSAKKRGTATEQRTTNAAAPGHATQLDRELDEDAGTPGGEASQPDDGDEPDGPGRTAVLPEPPESTAAEDVDGDEPVGAAARICEHHDLNRETLLDALHGATAIYHVQRELELSNEETDALLKALDLYEALSGGGTVTTDRARATIQEHIPSAGHP